MTFQDIIAPQKEFRALLAKAEQIQLPHVPHIDLSRHDKEILIMEKKIKTARLAYGIPSRTTDNVYDYLVQSVTDSTEIHPRQVLTKAQVDDLIAARDWRVTIVALPPID
jgi:hypothetical protein